MNFVNALSAISSNTWMFLTLCLGVFLSLNGQAVAGGSLITGSFAIMKSSNEKGVPS